jgi:2-polyprenyl-3-methyl-5-hydroxy-6-metoxy-1,4-benzoquinol methylase
MGEKLIFDLKAGEQSATESMETHEVSCLLCGGTEFSEVNRFKFNGTLFKTVQCGNDQMMWLQPQPTKDFYNRLYNTTYHGDTDPTLREQLTDEVGDDIERRQNDARIRLDEIEQLKTQGDLLEVGCGPGFVLKEARKRGWNVMGVEASEHYKSSLEQEGIEVKYGDLLTFDRAGKQHDVIALYSVFEHFTDPNVYIEKIKTLLKPGGLIVLRVPNTPSEGPQTSLMVHLYHFTPETLTAYLKQHGFEVQMLNADAGTYKSQKTGAETPNMNVIASRVQAA